MGGLLVVFFFFSSRRRHTRSLRDWSSDVCSSDLLQGAFNRRPGLGHGFVRRKEAAGELDLAVGETRISEGVSRVLRDGTIEILDGLRQRFRRKAAEGNPSLQVELIGLRV